MIGGDADIPPDNCCIWESETVAIAMALKEDPNSVACSEGTNCKPGKEDSILAAAGWSLEINSDLFIFRHKPSSHPCSSIRFKLAEISSSLPQFVYHPDRKP